MPFRTLASRISALENRAAANNLEVCSACRGPKLDGYKIVVRVAIEEIERCQECGLVLDDDGLGVGGRVIIAEGDVD